MANDAAAGGGIEPSENPTFHQNRCPRATVPRCKRAEQFQQRRGSRRRPCRLPSRNGQLCQARNALANGWEHDLDHVRRSNDDAGAARRHSRPLRVGALALRPRRVQRAPSRRRARPGRAGRGLSGVRASGGHHRGGRADPESCVVRLGPDRASLSTSRPARGPARIGPDRRAGRHHLDPLGLHQQCRRARAVHAGGAPRGASGGARPRPRPHAAGLRRHPGRAGHADRHASQHHRRHLPRRDDWRGLRHVRLRAGRPSGGDGGSPVRRVHRLAVDPARPT